MRFSLPSLAGLVTLALKAGTDEKNSLYRSVGEAHRGHCWWYVELGLASRVSFFCLVDCFQRLADELGTQCICDRPCVVDGLG